MTLGEARQLGLMLYFTATGRHDVDDNQWNIIIDAINKKYWNDVVSKFASIIGRDTPDTLTDGFGQLDYSGNIVTQNDINSTSVYNISTQGGWSFNNTSTIGGILAPDGSKTAWQLKDDSSVGTEHIAQLSVPGPSYPSPNGIDTIYAKAGSKKYIWLSPDSNATTYQFFNLESGTLGSIPGVGVVGTISPVPAPGFPWVQTPNSGGTSVISPSGWYKCTARVTDPTKFIGGNYRIGMSDVDTTSSYTGDGTGTVNLWGPRRSFDDNMLDPNGVHVPLSVELRFQGRYLHLDFELTQDRYIYNIAFGQVQVLIPSAWTLLGEKIIVLPRTSTPQPLRVTYVPRLAELVSDTQQLLNGLLPTYHPMIAYEVAASLSGDAKKPVFMPLMEMKQQWTSFLQKGRQRQTGRKIRIIPYE
jgi:hypothetical protein